jgi:mono/diheme cytochrome c family protein
MMRMALIQTSSPTMLISGLPVLLFVAAVPAHGAAVPSLNRQFDQTVRPYVAKYCVGCHSGPTSAAQLDLKAFTSADMVAKDYPHWNLVMDRLEAKSMPPKPMAPPPAEATQQVVAWIQAIRAQQIKKTAGDPGEVLARRLSNAEYNYTVRDLTGRDMQITKEFPVDPANTAGFDNSGESLTMSPGLLNKYLQAARSVADHMVLQLDGIDFAPFPMLVETDREKYSIQRIISFYQRQPTDYADYFEAAWRYRYRQALGKPTASLTSTAAASKVSAKYLPLVWQILGENGAVGPVAKLQTMWQGLPTPAANEPEVLRAKCIEMRDFVVKIRTHTAMQFVAPKVKGLPAQSQPLLNWKLLQFALHRRESDPNDLLNQGDPAPAVPEIPKFPGLHQEAAPRWAAVSAKARAGDLDLIVPASQRARYQAAFARFAFVFPDTFYVTERGRFFPDDSSDKGRLLSAGYHSVVGFFRDDVPLMELILDEKSKRELDRLWEDFDYIAHFTDRTWTQYFFNQSGEVQGKGAESASVRPTDHAITDAAVINAMRDAYEAKAKADPSNDPVAVTAIHDHFELINKTLRDLEKAKVASEPKQLEAMLRFAMHAYRRPLTAAEREDLLAYYHTLRTKNDLSHEDAIRQSLVGVLMSPDFLYRFDLLQSSLSQKSLTRTVALNTAVPSRPLSGYALASRLSYFLWSSMPDDELLRSAASGELSRREVLLAQTHRMLKDARVQGLATEFTGNWLDFRHFETNNSVDRTRFPTFNNDLREAMFQEPVRFVEDTIQHDRSILDLLYGDYTFVNPVLAQHYGIPDVKGTADSWTRVDNANQYGRGGLLPMAVFLTQNSPGLRTSPVKRGHWLVQRVLGEVIPAPPPDVPELPTDEAKSDLSVRQLLARHRDNPSCAACHARFDSFGLAFEGYGPVGGARTSDLAGRAVDTAVTYPGGMEANGFLGLQAFIREHRQQGFVENFSRKLLAYALNRSLQLSDEAVVERMETRLAARENRFSSLIDTIVTSPQFLNRRMPERHEKPSTPLLKGE